MSTSFVAQPEEPRQLTEGERQRAEVRRHNEEHQAKVARLHELEQELQEYSPDDLEGRYQVEMAIYEQKCRLYIDCVKPLPPQRDPLTWGKKIGTKLADGRLVLQLDLQAGIDGGVKTIQLRFSHEDLVTIRRLVEHLDLENMPVGRFASDQFRR
ncbi:MAG TPA: hypothetical protein PLZ55_12850 [bacterium]|nr:hypothetical protein [bacterium]